MKKPESKLQQLVQRLQEAGGDNLLSVVLYGSAAREEFHEQYSDVNVLAIFRDLSGAALSAITPVVRWWSHEERFTPPLTMTLNELRESADVFAIELFDIQSTHKTLFGEDVVSSIQVPMNLHRVEVEHELRTILLRLRQHFLLAPGNEDELRRVLAKAISSVITLFRHALITSGKNPAEGKPKVLEQAGEVFGFDARPLQTILELRTDPQRSVNAGEAYQSCMSAIGRVAHELDTHVPKRHLQKTSHTG
jgi:predicted nucleotidyltransferase